MTAACLAVTFSSVLALFEAPPEPVAVPEVWPAEEACVVCLDGAWEVTSGRTLHIGVPPGTSAFQEVPVCGVTASGEEDVRPDTVCCRTRFVVPAAWRRDEFFLAADGLHEACTVKVNGHRVAPSGDVCHIGAFLCSDAQNNLEIKWLREPSGQGGAWRPDTSCALRLLHLPQTHLQHVTCAAEKDGTVNVGVAATGRRTRCVVYIHNADGHLLRRTYRLSFVPDGEMHTCQLQIPAELMQLFGSPYRYTLTVELFQNRSLMQTYKTAFTL